MTTARFWPGITRTWWATDPAVTPCPKCGCPIQGRNITKAMAAHYAVVHGVAAVTGGVQ